MINQDYTLEYLLDRAYGSFSLDKSKSKLERPKVEKKDRKSYIINFAKMAESANRTVEELKKFYEDALKMDTSLKPDSSLKIDGMANGPIIENIFKTYIRDYVMCGTCQSVKTHTEKENRLTVLICDTCKCRKTIHISK
jgi:translation initiation factor 2 beta subunit (eIF-2beta)/eIF-5